MTSLNPQQFFHLTDNPDFALDPTKVPEDNAFAIRQRDTPGLFVGDPERWINGAGYKRPYVAEIHAPAEAVHDERWAGEQFIPAEHFDKATVARVIPTDAYARETYGEHGWAEEHHGTTFDTDEPIPERGGGNIPPLSGYRYSGPDARDMPTAARKRNEARWQEYADRPPQ